MNARGDLNGRTRGIESLSNLWLLLQFILVICLAPPASGQFSQLVSVRDNSQGASAGGSGDSTLPVISPDGRYVLFASTANNLVVTSNNAALPMRFPAIMNVFLRDRTNGTTALVSVNLGGMAGGDGDSFPVGLSTNGQFVVFESSASDLVAEDTNHATDVFLRDLLAGTTTVVSASTNGTVGNGASYRAALTPDAHYVAFASAASNLVVWDTNGIPDIFVRDLWSGVTALASVGARGAAPSSASDAPVITPNGHYVAFYSTATNLVPGPVNSGDIYVRDLEGGATVWASAGASNAVRSLLNATKTTCYNHAISDDGTIVAYEASPGFGSTSTYPGLILRCQLGSGATAVLHTNAWVSISSYADIHSLEMTPDGSRIVFVANSNGTSGATTCIMLWDAVSGQARLVSGDLGGAVPLGTTCDWPTIDPTGQFVAFNSSAAPLTTNRLVGAYHLYRRDTVANKTVLVDADASGAGSPVGPETMPQFSADGQLVAFVCADANLAPNDRNGDTDVFVRDLAEGARELISVRHEALASDSANGLSAGFAVSGDGRFAAFASDADNLISGDTNGYQDIFVRDLVNGTNRLASVATNGWADGSSTEPAMTPDGRYVAFTSAAKNLISGDNNLDADVYIRDMELGTTALVSVRAAGGGPGNRASYAPALSLDGRYCLFRSEATDLVAGSFSGSENLFLRDLQAGTTYALTKTGLRCAAMSSDGRFVAYVDMIGTSVGKLYVRNSTSAAVVYTNSTSGISDVAISPDGNRIVYCTGSSTKQITAVDRVANTSSTLGSGKAPSRMGLRFSADSRLLVYSAAMSNTNQVSVYDFVTGASLLVSRSATPGVAGNGASECPDISPDGRFIAYRSVASDLVAGDTNGAPDIFLFDRENGSTKLVSVNRAGNAIADGLALAPVFSNDGRTLIFLSWASQLVSADFNHAGDVYAYTVFSAAILPGTASGEGALLSWPAMAGLGYRVQFKAATSDAPWQDLPGTVTRAGMRAWQQDTSPDAYQRLYRVIGF